MKIRLTKEFKFEAAHALQGYDGLCKNIHGHSYRLFVTIIGEPISDKNSPKLGMVMDFGDLKKIVNELIVDKYDHALVLNQEMPFDNSILHTKIIQLPYQPTCENLLSDFASQIQTKLPASIRLFSLKMYETDSSYAEWFASDN